MCCRAVVRSTCIRSLFGNGQCAQSHYFKASLTLLPIGDDSFELVVRRSFADYFVKIMLDAAEPLMS